MYPLVPRAEIATTRADDIPLLQTGFRNKMYLSPDPVAIAD